MTWRNPANMKTTELHVSQISAAMKSPVFLALTALSTFLVAAIVFGLRFTSSAFSDSLLKPGGGLLDGLIANGISVVVSTILIAPLTAYFVNMRREHQLIPVRRGFVLSIAGSVDRLARQYILSYEMYLLSIRTFRDTSEGHTIKQSLEKLNEALEKISAERQGLSSAPKLVDSILTKTLQDASFVRSMVKDMSKLLY